MSAQSQESLTHQVCVLNRYYKWLRPWLFKLEPERAHDLSLRWLERLHRWGWLRKLASASHCVELPSLHWGLRFRNPVGLAAGLDKHAAHIDALAQLGFGFIEVGTVTPRPQPGNPQPRLFRVAQAQALINRMGFNNPGLDIFLQGLSRSQFRRQGGIVGVNIGKNADTPMAHAIDDYLTGLNAVYVHADYVCVNISSPNTSHLRTLQSGKELYSLLAALRHNREILAGLHQRQVPLLIKIAPDLEDAQVGELADAIVHYGIDGIIATNTTVSRVGVQNLPVAREAGGMSGGPLRDRSSAVLAALRRQLGANTTLIGAGGILSAEDACQRMQAGADLIQLYTGLIYRGPGLVGECIAALAALRFANENR